MAARSIYTRTRGLMPGILGHGRQTGTSLATGGLCHERVVMHGHKLGYWPLTGMTSRLPAHVSMILTTNSARHASSTTKIPKFGFGN
jgi:hypothetical protein